MRRYHQRWPPVKYYKVVSPFVAVRQEEHQGFITVPEGAIIELAGDPSEQPLVPIRFDNQTLMVFTRDLNDRSEQISSQGLPSPKI